MRAVAGASIWSSGSLEETRYFAVFLKVQVPGIARTALAEGWIDQGTIDAVVAEIDAWAESPDAFHVLTWCHALGWVSD